MTMIEKVARAICNAERYHQDSYELYLPAAKAAIEAMRNPDINMVEAGHSVHPNYYGPGLHPCVFHYRIMIDAALKED